MSGGIDVSILSRVTERVLINGNRPIIFEDVASGASIQVPADTAAAADGLLPVFVMAADALWQSLTGNGFEVELQRDIHALLGWRVKKVGGSISAIMLVMMEVMVQALQPEGIKITELGLIWEDSMAQVKARERALI
jgi:hypothetical protein